MRALTDTIKAHEDRLEIYDLSPTSKALTEDTLHHLKCHQSMVSGKKFCYRYSKWVVEQCEVCDTCLSPEDLAWNGDDV